MAFVDDIVESLKPKPPTERELALAEKVPLDDFTIYYDKIYMICDEAKELFVRSGVTTMLLSGDLIAGVYNAQGDLINCVCGAYIHAVTASPAIKYIIQRFKDDPTVGVKEGDIFFFNDILYGSLHSPDEAVVMPIFWEGELIGFAGAAVQQTEVGAIDPGMTPRAKSRWDEGLKMPPVKIGENYKLKTDMIEALANMCRTPEQHIIDTKARTIAADTVRRRIQDMVKEKGKDFVIGLFTRILLETEKGAREKLKRWQDGTYRTQIFFDSLGYKEGLQKFTMELIKEGDRILFDFTKTSQETDGPWNSFPHCVAAHVCSWLYGAVYADLPPSSGIFLSHDFKFRKGSILHAHTLASTNLSPPGLGPIIAATQACFAKMLYSSSDSEDKVAVMAPTSVTSGANYFGGVNQWGRGIGDMMSISLNTMGEGAKCHADGTNAWGFSWCPWGKATDVEDAENEWPWIYLHAEHLVDSGGFGRRRGGAAVASPVMVFNPAFVALASIGVNSKFALTPGLFGGYPACTLPGIVAKETPLLNKLTETPREVPSTTDELVEAINQGQLGRVELTHNVRWIQPIMQGEIHTVWSGGGGGYGDALDRESDLVQRDMDHKLISEWTAVNVYRVVFDPATGEIDKEATERRRQEEREARKKRGVSFTEFERTWLSRKPPEEALEFYGSWPDAETNTRPIFRL